MRRWFLIYVFRMQPQAFHLGDGKIIECFSFGDADD